MKTKAISLILVICFLLCCNFNSEGKGKTMTEYIIPANCNFEDVGHAYSSNACSPEIIIPTFEGVLINAPKRIAYSDKMEVMLACTFAFSLKRDLGVFKDYANEIVFTVVDQSTKIPYSGKVADMDHRIPNPDAPPAPPNREELPEEYHESYVNLDLIDVTHMPKKHGKYLVYATISTFKSNVLEFEIYTPK